MKTVRFVCLSSLVCLLLFSQTGLAAESAPCFTWTGPYLGLHMGYGWGNADTNVNPLPTPAEFDMIPANLSPDTDGVVGGIQAGYNYQMGRFVVGIETDLSGSGISGSQNLSPIHSYPGDEDRYSGGVITAQQDINWFATLRPRLGFTVMPNVLVYATGGLAYGHVSDSANTNFIPGGAGTEQYPTSTGSTMVGWTAGGGIEYALSGSWTIKAEYLYMDLGSESAIAPPSLYNPPYQMGYDWQTKANIFRVGMNYKF